MRALRPIVMAVVSALTLALATIPANATPAAQIIEYPTDGFPRGITGGPDGNLWCAKYFGSAIGRITTAGVITNFPTPTSNSQPVGIVVGPDGNLWFTESNVDRIGRITTSGSI